MALLHFLPRRVPQQGILPGWRHGFSTSSRCARYDDTLPNLKIGAHTRVLFQGFTGEISLVFFFSFIGLFVFLTFRRTPGDC